MSRLALAALLLASAALSGCGKLGPLDQPPPLYGDQAKAQYAAKLKAEAASRAHAKAEGEQPDTPDMQDTHMPVDQAPYGPQLPGGPSGANNQPPQGALPNPGATPDQ